MQHIFVLRRTTYLLVYLLGFLSFILFSCDGSLFKSSSSDDKETDPSINQNTDTDEDDGNLNSKIPDTVIKNFYNEWKSKKTDDEKSEFLEQYLSSDSSSQEVRVCFWYPTGYDDHWCDNAKFFVFFNNEITSGSKTSKNIINLNNGSARTVTTISGKTYNISAPVDNPNNSKEKIGFTVPGIQFKSTWKKGSFSIKTSCALKTSESSRDDIDGRPKCSLDYEDACCHVGITFMSIIGKLKFDYDGHSISSYFIQQGNNGISTGTTFTYNADDYISSSDLKKTEYKFDDLCVPVKK